MLPFYKNLIGSFKLIIERMNLVIIKYKIKIGGVIMNRNVLTNSLLGGGVEFNKILFLFDNT